MSLWCFLQLLVLVLVGAAPRGASSFLFLKPPPKRQKTTMRTTTKSLLPLSSTSLLKRNMMMIMNNNDGSSQQEQALEALQSLGDFHQGEWNGKGAISFTVTADVAAGIVLKKISPPYKVDVKLALNQGSGLTIDEQYSWPTAAAAASNNVCIPRVLSITDSSIDCDSVDGSYSLHTSNQPDYLLSLTDLIGTDKECYFCIEQCLAVSDNDRVRLLALYGGDNDHELIRIVLFDETRSSQQQQDTTSSSSLQATDLIEIQSDVDRLVNKIVGEGRNNKGTSTDDDDDDDRLQRLQESLTKQQKQSSMESSSSSSSDGGGNDNEETTTTNLKRHPMSLLELSSGVWLGDSIIRDFPTTSTTSTTNMADTRNNNIRGSRGGKGFGSTSSSSSSSSKKSSSSITPSPPPPFGSWEVGVQKVAREWLWRFGTQIRQNNDAGQSIGAKMEPGAFDSDIAGEVCENQSLSRRIPKEERMVYIDWNDSGNGSQDNHVGFLVGSVSIQVPRFATFGGSPRSKPFFTELCVYQTVAEDSDIVLPEVVCSRICRLYNTEGQLNQGCTSFYSLKRFDSE